MPIEKCWNCGKEYTWKKLEDGHMESNHSCEWKGGIVLVCPNKRWNGGRWIMLDKDPCPNCIFMSCHTQGHKSDEWNRCHIIKRGEGKGG